MTTKPPETAQQLRQRAEEKFSADETGSLQLPTPEETKNLLHDLRLHQIELEMQNEELRIKQRELDTARTRYFDLYDLAPMGYLTFNARGLIYEANLSAATMLGVTRKELFNKLMAQFLFHEDQDIYYLHRKRLLETGEVQGWDMRLMRADGSVFWAHLQGTQAHNGEYWIVFSDISERRKLEAEKLLLEQQFQQAQKLESLGVLAGGIAHDFNNILAIIMGYCSLTKMDYEKAEENIPHIEKATERAAALCRQMLAYAGKATLSQSQINLTAMVDEISRLLKATINQNVVINTHLTADLPCITADASQLRQVAMNLIINASEAIGEAQGVIDVSLSTFEVKAGQADKDHNGQIIPAGRYICLEVTDSGCGMDSETMRKIFEPFYTTKFTGRGLGMSATLGIIRAHKGALQLESQLGQGTTFKLYLPVQSGASGEESTQKSVEAPWKGSGTILLAEDEEYVMLIARTMLKQLGFNVIEAKNGLEALELYKENAADITLVVADMGMPVMDGYALFRELKKLDPGLPIIVSSGFGDAEVTSRIPREAIAGLVSKPYRFDQLREVLREVVD